MSIEEFEKKCEEQRRSQKKIVLDYKRKGITTYLLILFPQMIANLNTWLEVEIAFK